MKTFTPLSRDTALDPIQAIRSARKAMDIPLAVSLVQQEAKRQGGKISGQLAYQWALVLMADKKYAWAMDVLKLFCNQHPDTASAWFLMGQCSEILGEYSFAEQSFRESVRAHKRKIGQADQARSYFSLGSNLFRLGRNIEALDAWKRGLRGKCLGDEALFVRSQVNLCLGNYAEGWEEYEHRRFLPGWDTSIKPHVGGMTLPPEWDGKSEGRVFVYGEQGAGDSIMFVRWLDALCDISRWAFMLECGPDVNPLLRFASRSECDWSIPIASLPRVSSLHTYPPAPGELKTEWIKPDNTKPKIGVCWKGSSAHMNDMDRSSPIDFRDALQDERWDVVSLQYGISGFAPRDYLETAEIMRGLDAVVTVDTSVAHVGGTLGVPTVLIPPASPEWRWGLKDTTPWYPSIKIVRRERYDAWPDALRRAKQTLAEIVCPQ